MNVTPALLISVVLVVKGQNTTEELECYQCGQNEYSDYCMGDKETWGNETCQLDSSGESTATDDMHPACYKLHFKPGEPGSTGNVN